MTSLFFFQPVLAQVNVGGNPAALLGIVLALSGAGLYFMRTMRPQLARDYDIALAAIALLAGSILFFQGWRLDPILTFGYYLMAGAAGFFAFEAIKMRGAATEQAKRYSPVVDEERDVSPVYQAEIDDMPMNDARSATRRIRASRDYRSTDAEDYTDDGRRTSSRNDRLNSTRRRRPASRPEDSRSANRPSAYDRDSEYGSSRSSERSRADNSLWDEGKGSSPGSSDTSYRPSRSSGSERPRRPRPSGPAGNPRRRPIEDEPPANYVDYVDYTDSDADRSL